MKKVLMIIGGIVVAVIVVAILIYAVTYASSDKLVCTSDEGDITIMYNDSTLTGYTANGVSYDLDSQKEYAKSIGISAYIEEFSEWFSTNTTGSCVQK